MKIGLLHNKRTTNLGDDIQSFALENLLPRVDTMVDRENMNTDKHFHNKPTATVMAAWFMGRKWQWPPADCLRPLFTSFHYTDFTNYPNKYFRSEFQYISGPGAEYLNAWGPVGCRDLFTMEQLQARGIEAYFSGCVTLTLPKQPITKDAGKYVCLVDVPKAVEKKVREIYKDTGKEIRVMTHLIKASSHTTRAQRRSEVKKVLTTYQNAFCVITKRLHVMLPCLAMETPVVLVNAKMDPTRFRPYKDWVPSMTPDEFLERDVTDLLLHPQPNSQEYLPYREGLIEQITAFSKNALTVDNIHPRHPLPYTREEYLQWHNAVMTDNLKQWHLQFAQVSDALKHAIAQNATLTEECDKQTLALAELDTQIEQLQTLAGEAVGGKKNADFGSWKKQFLKLFQKQADNSGNKDEWDTILQQIEKVSLPVAIANPRSSESGNNLQKQNNTMTRTLAKWYRLSIKALRQLDKVNTENKTLTANIKKNTATIKKRKKEAARLQKCIDVNPTCTTENE